MSLLTIDGTTIRIVEISGSPGPQGPAGPTGPAGADGADGVDGVGVPAGGTTGQALLKASATDYDTEWGTAGSGTAVTRETLATSRALTTADLGKILVVNSGTYEITLPEGLGHFHCTIVNLGSGVITFATSGSATVVPTGVELDNTGDAILTTAYISGNPSDDFILFATTPESFVAEYALSDETTDLTTGTAVVTNRARFGGVITEVRLSTTVAPTGAAILVDLNKNGTSIFSTRPSIDATEKTSVTAATPAVISTSTFADDDELTWDIDQVGSTAAGRGLKAAILGYIL